MSQIDSIYDKLAAKMIPPGSKRMPKLLQKIANLEQARIMYELPGTAENVANKLGLDKAQVEKQLQYLYERGVATPGRRGWNMVTRFGLMKDLVGSANPKYDDAEVFALTREISLEDSMNLAERLKKGEKIPPLMQIMRVVPKWRSIKDIPGVLPIEDTREIFKNVSPIVVHRCPCRIVYPDRPCKDTGPVEVCFATGETGQHFINRGTGRKLTYDELIALLDQIDKFQIVNTTGNSNRMPPILCSCCNDCCGLFVRSFYTKPLLGQVPYAKSRFVVQHIPEVCVNCGTCAKRCPVNAAIMKDSPESGKKYAYTNTEECIGCGQCVLTCPKEARKMKLVRPPEYIPDFMMGLDSEGINTNPSMPKPKE